MVEEAPESYSELETGHRHTVDLPLIYKNCAFPVGKHSSSLPEGRRVGLDKLGGYIETLDVFTCCNYLFLLNQHYDH